MARPPRLGYGWPNSYDPVDLGSDDGRRIKATGILSTPMAVLSRGAKGNDVSRLMAVLSRPMAVLSRGAKSNASRPMAVLSRPMTVLSRTATLEPG